MLTLVWLIVIPLAIILPSLYKGMLFVPILQILIMRHGVAGATISITFAATFVI